MIQIEILADWVISIEEPLDFDWEWTQENIVEPMFGDIEGVSEHIFDSGFTNASSETGNQLIVSYFWQNELSSLGVDWSEFKRRLKRLQDVSISEWTY